MRADRLLTIVLLLQRRGRQSVAELAARVEVSERTILRDMDALGAAGIPVAAVRGPGGGFELIPGYRTDLSTLTGEECAALQLLGLPAAAAALGFEGAHSRLRLKLDLLLTDAGKASAALLNERFLHLEPEIDLATRKRVSFLRQATWRQRAIAIYSRGGLRREVEPLGLVLQSGDWFLVANSAEGIEAHAVAGMGDTVSTGRRFDRPPEFDLGVAWRELRLAQEDSE